jgi:hypothetical protein
MGLPRTLQNLMLFNEGQSYVGEVKTVTLPTLTRKLEEYRGGGMSAPVKVVAMSQKVRGGQCLRHWARCTGDDEGDHAVPAVRRLLVLRAGQSGLWSSSAAAATGILGPLC